MCPAQSVATCAEPSVSSRTARARTVRGADSGSASAIASSKGSASKRKATPYVSWYGKGTRKQNWRTPPDLFRRWHRRFRFTLDGASEPGNELLPRARVKLAADAELAVFLVPARTNARWFHYALRHGAKVEFFPGRPKFVGGKGSSPVDCLLLVFRRSRPSSQSSLALEAA